MIQSIYTSVSNADIVPCGKKGKPIKCEPIPLLRNNYLGEYRTELEKAKVRKNLGIADEQSLLWGNISGTIELQKDLVQYIEQKWTYTSDVAEGINTVKDALDYALYFISEYESNTEAIEELKVDISNIRTSISVLKEDLQREIDTNRKGINNLSEEIVKINEAIVELNNAIENIDVDKNILNWIKNSLQNSNEVSFGIMFNQRTNKLYQKIKEIVASGELGEIRRSQWMINSWWRPDSYYQQSAWRATWGGEGGGVLVNQAPHQLDLWQWICGIPVKVFSKNINGCHRNIGVENDVTMLVVQSSYHFDNLILIRLQPSSRSGNLIRQELQIKLRKA